MSEGAAIVARKHGLSLGWQVVIVVAMGLVSTTTTATAIYFGLKGAIEKANTKNDEQDKELQRKAERSEVDALKLSDVQITARIDRERADWKEFAGEIKGQLRDINASLKQIVNEQPRGGRP